MPILKPSHRPMFVSLMAALGLVACALVVSASPARAATWSIQTTPNASGAEHSELYDIACGPTSTNACVSVGKQTASGGSSGPYAQFWNGSSWANQTTVTPEGATAGELQAVDCSSESLCVASGSYTSGGVITPLIEYRSSGTWSLLKPQNPSGASEAVFKGVSCRSFFTICAAAGYSVKSGVKTSLAELFTTEGWVIQTLPTPEGAVSNELLGIDCPSAEFSWCMAVGGYTLSGGAQWGWSAVWNGLSWTLQTVAKPSESKGSVLLDVSCSSSSNCTGVGGYRNSSNVQVSFVERWNGTSWSHQSSPNPTGSTNTVFQNVSCVASTPCVAVGDWNNGKTWQPMAQEWNGSAWALDTTPTPEGATFSLLAGVACRSAGCLATGFYTDSGGKNKTLGEKR